MLREITARLGARAARRAILATLGIATLLVAWPTDPVSAGEIVSVERDHANARERAIAQYWTKRRIRKAEPLPSSPASADTASARRRRGEPGYVGPIAPGGDELPRWHRGTTPGEAAAPKSATTFESGPVETFDTPPNTTAGKLYGRLPGFGKYECSATAVAAPNRSLVLTAGHCLGEKRYGLARHIVFIPSYNYEQRPFGTWVERELFIPRAWIRRENFNYDFGALVVGRRKGDALEDLVGGRGFAYNQPRNQIFTAIGYPGNRDDAQRMWYCRSAFHHSDAPTEERGPAPLAIGCDMGLGASGGGWIINDLFVNSVSSYFYPRDRELLYGPYFGNRARRLVQKAGA